MSDLTVGASLGFTGDDAVNLAGTGATFESTRDPRFIVMDKNGDTEGWVAGENVVTLLPPESEWLGRYQDRVKEAADAGKPQPQLLTGNPYFRIAVKYGGAKNQRTLRTTPDNYITDAFRKLYESLKGQDGKLTEELKSLGDATGGFGDHRMVLNVLLHKNRSTLRWFDCPVDNAKKFRDYMDGNEQKCRVGTQLIKLVMSSCKITPQNLPLFDLSANIPLRLGIALGGSERRPIPQYTQFTMIEDFATNKPITLDIQKQLFEEVNGQPPILNEAALDDAGMWTSQLDELPELTDIPGLMQHGEACEILGLSTAQAESRRVQHAGVSTADLPTSGPEEASTTQEAALPDFSEALSAAPSDDPGTRPGAKKAEAGGELFSTLDAEQSQAVADFDQLLDQSANTEKK